MYNIAIHHLFESQVARTPDKVAVADRAQHLTYRQLNKRSNQLAHSLMTQGFEPGSIIAISLDHSVETIIGILAVLKIGGVCLPIDSTLPERRAAYLLEDSHATCLLMRDNHRDQISLNVKTILIDSADLSLELGTNIGELDQFSDTLAVSYIPRSTGYPEAIKLSSRSILTLVEFNTKKLKMDFANILCLSNLETDAFLPVALTTLLNGGAIHLCEQDDASGLSKLAKQEQMKTIFLSAAFLSRLFEEGRHGEVLSENVNHVVTSGNDVIEPEQIKNYLKSMSIVWYNYYGLPEFQAITTVKAISSDGGVELTHIGKPITGTRAFILDSESAYVPVGIAGELYVSGESLFQGYLNGDAGENGFRDCPFSPGETMYKTGYTAKWLPDGIIEFCGRVDNQATVNGCRIALEEIEAALYQYEAIERCSVVLRNPDGCKQLLVAYLVSKVGIDSDKLQEHLKRLLPGAIFPVGFVQLSALPLTVGGEIDRKRLQRLAVFGTAEIRQLEEYLTAGKEIVRAVALAPLSGQRVSNRGERALSKTRSWSKKILDIRENIIPGIGIDPDEIQRVAVEARERIESPAPLHLSEVLANWKAVPADRVGDSPANSARPDAGHLCPQPRVAAFSDGGQLVIPEDAPTTLTDALIRAASAHPDKGITYIQPDGSEIFQSYPALLQEARCIMTGLNQMGMKAGDKAILQIASLSDHFAAFWACVLSGITPVTVAVAPSYESKNAVISKLHNTWELLSHPAILASEQLTESISGLSRLLPMEGVKVVSVTELQNHVASEQIYQSKPDDLVFFQLTSGSTGTPKCIQETHRGIISHIHGSKQSNSYTTDDVSLNWLPVDHVVPILTYHLKDVYLGCQQVQVKTEIILANPLKWLSLIEEHKVTHTWSPNFGFKLVADQLIKQQHGAWDLSSIKYFMNAGEQVTLPVVREFLKAVGKYKLSMTAMQPAFGMAEVCTCMTYQNDFDIENGIDRIEKATLGGRLNIAERTDEAAINFVHLGRPIPGVQIRITDNDNHMVEECTIGRLQIRGQVVTPGYYKNEEANSDAFVGDGWFNTGDLGYILDAHLTITGREKEMIIINGANYYCYEIEDIVNGIEGVEPTYAAACGVEDAKTGTEALAIFYTPVEEGEDKSIELIKRIRSLVSISVGISPGYVVPVKKNEFPKTTSGKIQRTQLKKALGAGEFDEALKEIDLLSRNENTIPNWFFKKVWHRQNLPPVEAMLQAAGCLIFDDESGLCDALEIKFRSKGYQCIKVRKGSNFEKLDRRSYLIDIDNPSHYLQLVEEIGREGLRVSEIIHLLSYGDSGEEISSLEALRASQGRGVYSLLSVIQALAQHPLPAARLTVVTSNLQATTSAETPAFEKCTMPGLLKTVALELAWLRCCHIDLEIDEPKINGELIFKELCAPKPAAEVAYRQHRRLVPYLSRIDATEEAAHDIPFKKGGIYLITGALGGIGAQVAKMLMERYEAKLILMGRTSLPARNEWDHYLELDSEVAKRIKAYKEIEATGGEFIYSAINITDPSGLRILVAEAEARWKDRLSGVLHLAGHMSLERHWEGMDKHWLIAESRESFESMFEAKVYGAWALDQLVRNRPGAIFISFSSINGFFGGATFGAYSAASGFLDGFSHYQRGRSKAQAYCLDWSTWDNLGMSRNHPAEMTRASRSMGYSTISLQEGLNSLLIALRFNLPQLLIGLDSTRKNVRRILDESFDYKQLLRVFYSTGKPVDSSSEIKSAISGADGKNQTILQFQCVEEIPLTPGGEIDREELFAMAEDAKAAGAALGLPTNRVEEQMVAIWRDVLGKHRVGVYDNFFELGGHSLVLAQVRNRLLNIFNREVTMVEMFKYPTISSLTKYLSVKANTQPTFQLIHDRARKQEEVLMRQKQRAKEINQGAD